MNTTTELMTKEDAPLARTNALAPDLAALVDQHAQHHGALPLVAQGFARIGG